MKFEIGDIVCIKNDNGFRGRIFTVEEVEDNFEESIETGELIGGPDIIWGTEINGLHHVVYADEIELIQRGI